MRDEGSYAPASEEDREIIRAHAIAHCELCNDDGYRGATICDHRMHSTPDARERAKALVAETLERQRRAKQAAPDDSEANA